jgi:hypothetical protein
MPLLRDTEEEGGYRRLLETTFSDLVKEIQEDSCSVPDGVLAGMPLNNMFLKCVRIRADIFLFTQWSMTRTQWRLRDMLL